MRSAIHSTQNASDFQQSRVPPGNITLIFFVLLKLKSLESGVDTKLFVATSNELVGHRFGPRLFQNDPDAWSTDTDATELSDAS